MHLRSFRLAFVLAGAVALAACEGTVGTVEDSQTGSESPSGTASTSGTGADSVSGTDTTATGTGESGTTVSAGTTAGHVLDDPASPLGTRTIYFEFDSSEVPASGQAVIEAHARYLSEHSGALITLEGHADERGSREYNIALGEQRANAVNRLMTLLGASGPQIRTISYGEERPAADGHDESAWQLNRRVEIIYRVRE